MHGEGTTVKIYLPRTDALADVMANTSDRDLPRGAESVLVVEDDASVRQLAVAILREQGYQVQESANAFEGV